MSEKFLKAFLVCAALAVFGYVFFSVSGLEWRRLYNKYFPCTEPITYSLGSFDDRFGISRKDFLETMAAAETIWEKPIGKNLFLYQADSGDLKVNLIYDYRQEATVKIHDLGLSVSDTRASYDALKAKYEALRRGYLDDKAEYQARVAAFEERQAEYNRKVAEWNRKGGAPRDVYVELKREADSLAAELAAIRKMENNLNSEVDSINTLVAEINRLAKILNINAGVLNTIGESRGEEFTEGEYKSDAEGEEIDIYEFSTKEKLERVLAHELGHALGLDHVEDPKAIMYRLNQGTNAKLTADDLAELEAHCKIK